MGMESPALALAAFGTAIGRRDVRCPSALTFLPLFANKAAGGGENEGIRVSPSVMNIARELALSEFPKVVLIPWDRRRGCSGGGSVGQGGGVL